MRLKSLHHVKFQVNDLATTEKFAQDFGLITVEICPDRLIMRTNGGDSYAYVAERGDAAVFTGFAFEVESEADLEEAVRVHKASPIRTLDMPGGGKAVTLTDPNGIAVDLIHGVARIPPGEAYAPLMLNSPLNYVREGRFEPKRPLGPAKLFRIGHVGLFIPSFMATLPWYVDVLGLIPSDVYHLPGQPGIRIVGFLRLNRGEELVDHHCVALMQSRGGETACHHISFEAQDFEAQFMSHRYLESKGYELVWGVGRHPHGSHVFDVWRDPDRNRFETFTDTDRLRASDGTRVHGIHEVEMDVWSSDPPDRYFA
ncbi:VOC family protein [Nitrospirillum iridis]|uniref:Catechol 2,3-dioxygenase-like lactoylglutathione lyase family enzyme n=1 Tax=Nitrospirillum iridis TaxID=765888 RepID=A0A7X0B6J1_9PROT|nr:VOC family protein [Nitrospirillum iridis]MBB6255396.1 catechol 2,3-dioxygenase-like lactoylglutathione lyase family enzyme [Nitrospirillum iridis]